MNVKYLYIDDEEEATLQSYASLIGDGTSLTIVPEPHQSFDPLIEHIVKQLSNYDGLILDWRLDQFRTGDQKMVAFRAGAVAQELRSRGASLQEAAKELPIVLWSTQQKLAHSYSSDSTSHDLFDRKYDKNNFTSEAPRIRTELNSLVQGYQAINGQKQQGFCAVLGVEEDFFTLLDVRFTKQVSKETSTHDYARFILREAILTPSPLISEDILAARLGVSKEKSSDWQNLLSQLPAEARYTGPFHEAWPRWWTYQIEKVWWPSLEENQQNVVSLGSLNAQQRVDRLNIYLELGALVPAEPIKEGYSTRFRTICEVDEKPLDPIDGVLISSPSGKEPMSWQDRRYMSLDAALARRFEDASQEHKGIRIHPLEIERVKELRSMAEDA